jgi:hypothetical protein
LAELLKKQNLSILTLQHYSSKKPEVVFAEPFLGNPITKFDKLFFEKIPNK